MRKRLTLCHCSVEALFADDKVTLADDPAWQPSRAIPPLIVAWQECWWNLKRQQIDLVTPGVRLVRLVRLLKRPGMDVVRQVLYRTSITTVQKQTSRSTVDPSYPTPPFAVAQIWCTVGKVCYNSPTQCLFDQAASQVIQWRPNQYLFVLCLVL